MQEKKRKFPFTPLETILLAILTPIIYLGTTMLLFKPMNSVYMPDWFFSWLGFFIVLGFDVVWVVIMRLWPLKNIKVKIVLTVLVITLSASVLTCWVALNALSDVW